MRIELDLNKAGLDELASVSFLDRQTAVNIVRFRADHGPFSSWEAFGEVPGLTPEVISLLRIGGAWFGGNQSEAQRFRGEFITRGSKGAFGNDDIEEPQF